MQDTAGKVGTNSLAIYSCGPLHIDKQRQDDQLEPTYNSSGPISDVSLKTYRNRWTIEKGGGRGSERSALMARHDHDKVFLSNANSFQTNLLNPLIELKQELLRVRVDLKIKTWKVYSILPRTLE